MRSLAKRAAAPALAIGMLLSVTGTAFAHECFIVNRSDQGAVQAGTNSKQWFYVGSLSEVIQLVNSDPELGLGLAPLTDAQLAWATQQATALGLPNQLTVFGNHTLMEGTPAETKHSTDGKGVDHIFDYFPQLMAIIQQAHTM